MKWKLACLPLAFVRIHAWLLIAIILLAPCAACADDWPQWRGTNRNSKSAETGWLDVWPPTVVWQKTIETGYSGVSVSDGRAYTMGWTSDGSDSNIVYCFDALTGTSIWEQAYQCGYGHGTYRGPRATPTVHTDGNVYTFSQNGHLHCWDKVTGSLQWNATITGGKPGYAYAGSPLIEGNMVLLNATGSKGVAVSMTAPHTNVWQSTSGTACYSSPVAFTWNSKRLVAFFSYNGLRVVDPANGVIECQYNKTGSYNAPDPIVYGDKIFIANGRSGYCALLRLGSGAMSHAWSGESTILTPQYSSCVLQGDYIYGIHGASGYLRCVDLRDETLKWSETGLSLGEGTLIGADGRLIVLSYLGYLRIGKASPSGFDLEGRSSYRVATDPIWRTLPTLVDGLLYCRSRAGTLACLRVQGTPSDDDTDGMGDTWEQEYFGGTTNCAAGVDSDGDGASNMDEYGAGTDPTNAQSCLKVDIVYSNGSILVSCPTAEAGGIGYDDSLTRYYDLESRSNLVSGAWLPVVGRTNIVGDNTTITYTNGAPGIEFHRVKARLE